MGNFKMRCVDKCDSNMYTTGKVYEYKDGKIKTDDGTINMIFDTFKEFQELSMAEWELITENQITKEELEDGDICVLRDTTDMIVFKRSLVDEFGCLLCKKFFNTNLTHNSRKDYDIMEVYRNKTLIYKKEEKSAQQIEIESIQSEMEKLNKRLEVLKGEM